MKATFIATASGNPRGGVKSLLATIALLPELDRQLVVRGGEQVPDAPGVRVQRLRAKFDLARVRADGVRGGFKEGAAYCGEVASLFAAVKKFKPDLIHCNDLDALALALPCARLLRARVVLHVRDIPNRPVVTARALALCDAGIAVSESVARSVAAAAPSRVRGRIRVIHNPVSASDLLSRDEAREKLGLDGESVTVGYIGAFEPRKGQLEFLSHVWPDLRHRARLVMIGPATDPEYCRRCDARALEIGGSVTLMDYVPAVERYLPAFDVVVLASLHEGLPRVALECAAAERPAVLFDAGGAHEAVIDGVTGCVVEMGDWRSLAGALERLLADRGLRERMGRAAAARARQVFGGDLTRAALLSMYSELLPGVRV